MSHHRINGTLKFVFPTVGKSNFNVPLKSRSPLKILWSMLVNVDVIHDQIFNDDSSALN